MEQMNYILITNNAEEAKCFAKSNISRVMVDLEILGKDERQGHLNTVISRHTIQDVKTVREAIDSIQGTQSKLLVRINPENPNSAQEIDDVINNGADYIMLPMFTSFKEVDIIAKLINNRAKLVLLCEHYKGLDSLDEILTKIKDIDEVHLGLNDLRISIGYNFLFSAFPKGHAERFADIMKKHNMPFGIGGISALGSGDLPADKILTEHAKLGSTRVILSRHFKTVVFGESGTDFNSEKIKTETNKISDLYETLQKRSPSELQADSEDLFNAINKIEDRLN